MTHEQAASRRASEGDGLSGPRARRAYRQLARTLVPYVHHIAIHFPVALGFSGLRGARMETPPRLGGCVAVAQLLGGSRGSRGDGIWTARRPTRHRRRLGCIQSRAPSKCRAVRTKTRGSPSGLIEARLSRNATATALGNSPASHQGDVSFNDGHRRDSTGYTENGDITPSHELRTSRRVSRTFCLPLLERTARRALQRDSPRWATEEWVRWTGSNRWSARFQASIRFGR